jgi:hypothetical protein
MIAAHWLTNVAALPRKHLDHRLFAQAQGRTPEAVGQSQLGVTAPLTRQNDRRP